MSRRSGLRDTKLPLKAGVNEILKVQGNYFRLSKAVYPVVLKIEGQDVFELSPGDDVIYPVDEEFERIEIKSLNPADEIITFTIGKGVRIGSSKTSGSVTISAVINGAGKPVVAMDSDTWIGGIYNPVKVVEDGFNYGGSFKSNTSLGANAPETVFTPAANVNGAIIHLVDFYSNNNSYNMCLIAKNAAPSTVIDGDVIVVNKASSSPSFSIGGGSLQRAVRIAPGKGLYFISTASEVGGLRSVLYTLL